MIDIQHLTKRYGDVLAVDDISFAVAHARVTGFVGPNGAGKTTTMRMILGLDAPSGGTVLIGGRPYRELSAPLRTIGALLDAAALDDGRTAAHHLLWLARSNDIDRRRVDTVLDQVGLQFGQISPDRDQLIDVRSQPGHDRPRLVQPHPPSIPDRGRKIAATTGQLVSRRRRRQQLPGSW